MGVMSRRVVPVCGNLCFFCPSMRARSRQPVKRYKKLLADIFPRNQDAELNDRKIGKLCEYVSKNPLRIPKITEYLEQKFYKDLRNEQFGSIKVVLHVYKKLLASCKEQMPLFSSSLSGIIRTLLEQTGQDEMQIMGCSSVVDFINGQTDSTYMFNLEGLIPKLCQLAQEVGDDERALRLRSAGLQALASMVQFMGEHSHVSMDFDNIISVTLENYLDISSTEDVKEDIKDPWVQSVVKAEDHGSSFPDMSKRVSSLPKSINTKIELLAKMDTSKNPPYWSCICLQNMAKLAKEATTVRRVLEPLFHCFDTENHWSPGKGIACSVLTFFQSLLEESASGNSHLLLSILVKHLDHKNVVKKPLVQIDIVNVATRIAQTAKPRASVSLIGAINDLIKHLRKCLQCSIESSSGEGVDTGNADLQCALENCISQLSNKVGDVGPILDMMGVVLENIPPNSVVGRTTISALYRTAQLISSIPNVSYYKKAFPDALFHHLLLAMAHPDCEARIEAHHIFSTLLMPSSGYPWSFSSRKPAQVHPWLSPVTSEEGQDRNISIQDEDQDHPEKIDEGLEEEEIQTVDQRRSQSVKCPSRGQLSSPKQASFGGKHEWISLRLSSHQVSLLLSSIWIQAASAENTPANFEALAHTYNIALLFSRSKVSNHAAFVRCLQLAFSLRSISIDPEGGLPASRRRSLFTLASSMLIFSARAGNIAELLPIVKSSLTTETIDPYLQLVDDIRLQVDSTSPGSLKIYGSEEDEAAAMKSISAIEINDQQLKETVMSHFMTRFSLLSEDELSSIKKQLSEGYSLDDSYPLGAPLFMETPRPCSPLARMEFLAFDEVMAPAALTDAEAFPDPDGSQSGRKTSLSISSLDILSVNQLLESVLETARQVASFPTSSTPIPYDQVKNQCEALVTGKQQKMSVLHSFKQHHESNEFLESIEIDDKIPYSLDKAMDLPKLSNGEQFGGRDHRLILCSLEYGQQQSFRLPPSSPYDKFLKAAGC